MSSLVCAIELQEDDEGNRSAPETIMLVPAGDRKGLVHARDERVFSVDREKLIELANANGADLLLDRGHESLMWGGGTEPAAGWLVAETVRKQGKGKHAAIIADVKWTPEGQGDVENLRWRYVSPAFDFRSSRIEETKDGTQIIHVERLLNAGIVNMPALRMPALAASEDQDPPEPTPKEPETMNLSAVAIALGLAAEATEQDVLTAAAEARGQLASQKVALEETQTQLVAAQAELKANKDTHAASLLDARVEKMVAGEKLTPAMATKLREKIVKFTAAGALNLLEDELVEIESRDAHSAANTSGAAEDPAPEPTGTILGRTRADVEAAAAESGLELDVYLKHQAAFRPLFPEWKNPPAQQSA